MTLTRPIRRGDPLLKIKKATTYAYLPTSIAAFQATNDSARDVPLYRAAESFMDSGRQFGAGATVIPNDRALVNRLVNSYALNVFALKDLPADVVPMRELRIAVYGDEGVRY